MQSDSKDSKFFSVLIRYFLYNILALIVVLCKDRQPQKKRRKKTDSVRVGIHCFFQQVHVKCPYHLSNSPSSGVIHFNHCTLMSIFKTTKHQFTKCQFREFYPRGGVIRCEFGYGGYQFINQTNSLQKTNPNGNNSFDFMNLIVFIQI